MAYCRVTNCENATKEYNKEMVRLHGFPNDETAFKKWANACGTEFKYSSRSDSFRVCSLHFAEDDWILRDRLLNLPIKKRRLNPDVIPTLNLPNPPSTNKRKERLQTRKRRQIVIDAIADFDKNTCSVLCCGKTLPSSSAHNISYLPYPADPALVIKWWAATGRKPTNDFDSTGYKICSLHFTNQDWVVDRDSQRILKATAVPSKNVAKLEQNICSLAVCRLCLAESDVIGDLFTENSVSKYLLKMLGRVLQTEVEDYVNWPQKICIDCFNALHKFGSFCQVMKTSHLTIKERYGDPVKKVDKAVEFVDVNSAEFLNDSSSSDEQEPVLEFREMVRVEPKLNKGPEYHLEMWPEKENCTPPMDINDLHLSKALVCDKCPGVKFQTYQSLQKHLGAIHNLEHVKCCGESFHHQNDFYNHISLNPSSKHDSLQQECDLNEAQFDQDPMIKCRQCDASFSNKICYNKHTMSHVPSEFPCESCSEKFITKYQLQLHNRKNHNKHKTMAVCHICGSTTRNLKEHINSKHNLRKKRCFRCGRFLLCLNKHQCAFVKQESKECLFCKKMFANNFSLRLHISRTHREDSKQFMCAICGKVYKRKDYLKDHIASRHTKEVQYRCSVCGQGFFTYCQYNVHMNSKHKEEYDLLKNKKFDKDD